MKESKKNRIILIVVGVILIGLAAFSLFLGIINLKEYIRQEKNFVKIDAIVIELVEKETELIHQANGEYRRRIVYAEIVQYEIDGKTYTKEKDSASSKPQQVGSKIIVLYNPSNPEDCVFPKTYNLILIVSFGLAIGFVVCFILCIKVVIKDLKEENKQDTQSIAD